MYLAVDGPRSQKPGDADNVSAVEKCVELIDWTEDVTLISRPHNLGMRIAVPDAVTQVISQHGRAIVVEDDLVVGSDFIPYSNYFLEKHKNDEHIAHINGYSAVPKGSFSHPDVATRLTRYPQSFGWATWARAWKNYDDSLSFLDESPIAKLREIHGNEVAALHWRLVLENVRQERISSWAYRWIASTWGKNQFALGPLKSLVNNRGYDVGSHNLTKAPWKEPQLSSFEWSNPSVDAEPIVDPVAEQWISRVQNRNTVSGLAREVAVTAIRTVIKEKH